MVLPMMSIRLAQRLIAPHPSNTVFHHDPPPRERPIIRDIVGWTVFPTRLATRTSAKTFWVQFGDPHVGQITNPAHALWQPLEHLRLLQHGAIRRRAGRAVGPIHNLATLLVDRDLAFERMPLFLPAVMRIRCIVVFAALHALLKGVNHDSECRCLAQQSIQLLAAFATRIGQAP